MKNVLPSLSAIHAVYTENCAIDLGGDIHAHKPNLVIVASCPVWILESKKGNSHLTVYKNLYAPEIDVVPYNGALYITDRNASTVSEDQEKKQLIVLSVPYGIRNLLAETKADSSLTVEPPVDVAHITLNGKSTLSMGFAKTVQIIAGPFSRITGNIADGADVALTGMKASISRLTLGKNGDTAPFASMKSTVEGTGIITTTGNVRTYKANAVSKSAKLNPSRPQGCICHIGDIAIKKSTLSNGNFVHCRPKP